MGRLVMGHSGAPQVEIQTTVGSFVVELYVNHAPQTCKNFKDLAAKGYYDNTVVRHILLRYPGGVRCGGARSKLEWMVREGANETARHDCRAPDILTSGLCTHNLALQ